MKYITLVCCCFLTWHAHAQDIRPFFIPPPDSGEYALNHVAIYGEKMLYGVDLHTYYADVNNMDKRVDLGIDMFRSHAFLQLDSLVLFSGDKTYVVNLNNGEVLATSDVVMNRDDAFLIKTDFGCYVIDDPYQSVFRYDRSSHDLKLVFEGKGIFSVGFENGQYSIRTKNATIAEDGNGLFTDTIDLDGEKFRFLLDFDSFGVYQDGANKLLFSKRYDSGDTSVLFRNFPVTNVFLTKKKGSYGYIYKKRFSDFQGGLVTDGTPKGTHYLNGSSKIVRNVYERGDTLIEMHGATARYFVGNQLVRHVDVPDPKGGFSAIQGDKFIYFVGNKLFCFINDTSKAYEITDVNGKSLFGSITTINNETLLGYSRSSKELFLHYFDAKRTKFLPRINRIISHGSLQRYFITSKGISFSTNIKRRFDEHDDPIRLYEVDVNNKRTVQITGSKEDPFDEEIFVIEASKFDLIGSGRRLYYRVGSSNRVFLLTEDDDEYVLEGHIQQTKSNTYFCTIRSIYKTDGSPEGTERIFHKEFARSVSNLILLGDTILAYSQGALRYLKDGELYWLIEGVNGNRSHYYSSKLHKAAISLDIQDDFRMFVTNGTHDSTQKIGFYDQFEWSYSFDKRNVINDKLIIYAINDDGGHFTALDLSSNRAVFLIRTFTMDRIFAADNDYLYFAGRDSMGNDGLWKTDGTVEGTSYIIGKNEGIDIPTRFTLRRFGGDDYQTHPGAIYRDKLYFPAEKQGHGIELWRTDGTAEGTEMVEDYEPGRFGIRPYSLQIYQDSLIFVGESLEHGLGLFGYYEAPVTQSKEENLHSNIKVYPNPARGNLRISSTVDFWQIEVVDQNGKVLITNENSSSNKAVTLDVSSLGRGVYFVKARTKEGPVLQKFITL